MYVKWGIEDIGFLVVLIRSIILPPAIDRRYKNTIYRLTIRFSKISCMELQKKIERPGQHFALHRSLSLVQVI